MKTDKIITREYHKLMTRPFPGDSKGRTGAELIAQAAMKEAINGSVPAMQMIAERLEGKTTERLEINDQRTREETVERIQRLVARLRESNEIESVQ
jgi:hypothetical protein